MAVDWTLPAPADPEKQGDYLHDRERIPAPPPPRTPELVRRWGIVSLGIVIAIGLTVMAFTTYSAWDDTRDVLLVLNVSIAGPAGAALGYLLYRQRWDFAGIGLGLAALTLLFIGMNAMRAYTTDGEDLFRDLMSIFGAVSLGVLFIFVMAATAWVELKDPTRAPEPEM